MLVRVTVPEARRGCAGAGVAGKSTPRATFAFGGVAPAPCESEGRVGAPQMRTATRPRRCRALIMARFERGRCPRHLNPDALVPRWGAVGGSGALPPTKI